MVDKETRKAALDFLDPQKPEAGPLEVYEKLPSSLKRSLAELASQVKNA